jgi:MFS family permease
MFKRLKKFCRRTWEWGVLLFTLLALAIFLTGTKILGLTDAISFIMALITAILAPLLSFLLATLILPLIALLVGIITALITLVMGLGALLIGGIFTPILAILTGWLGSIVAWVASTWLGTLLMPVYGLLSPVVLKITPFITTSKYAVKAYNWAQNRLNPPTRKLPRRAASASQNASRGRSSAPAKPHRAPARARR